LWRVHRIRLHRTTIPQVFHRLGLPHLPRRRKRAARPRQLRLFEKPEPGDSVQIDVKHVKISGHRAYQYTALDDCTRQTFPDFEGAAAALRGWEAIHDYQRLLLALKGPTPAEKLAARPPQAA
jgi:hypothetical protein